MGNVLNMNSYKADKFNSKLNEAVMKLEEDLGIEEPLTIMTDDTALSIVNALINIKENVEEMLSTLGYEGEVESLEDLL